MTDDPFAKNLVKEFKHWSIYVHDNQSYLGRCVIWCKREDALDLADATPDEQTELFQILPLLRTAVQKSFEPDWFNYAFLGNETRHLHGHFIPRYQTPREFMGITFTDERWGKNYLTDKDFITPKDVLSAIKDTLIRNI